MVTNRSGMWISQGLDGRSFEITDVVTNGPAAMAGLKAGDKILAMDGRKTDQIALLEARAKFECPKTERTAPRAIGHGAKSCDIDYARSCLREWHRRNDERCDSAQ
jgi:C-terminal processing protease CtpA/Prc